jgi:diadenosine tetraphosphatase ApaH/serine/threonine PP2A family protein phosphatase
MHTELPPRRIGVFSDIHGNLHALEAVLHALDAMEIRDMVCCGDVVGYGALPNECIELLRFRRIPTLAGNHDHAALEITDVKYFNEIARAAVEWTRQRLSRENLEWLRERPYTLAMPPEFYFAHASPHQPENWGYVLTFGDARQAFGDFQEHICFIGHSHQPAAVEFIAPDALVCPEQQQVPLVEGSRYLINVGSVGQPRDRNPQASFVTVDLDAGHIEFHRVDYDIEEAQAAILKGGLPEELAERLAFGW